MVKFNMKARCLSIRATWLRTRCLILLRARVHFSGMSSLRDSYSFLKQLGFFATEYVLQTDVSYLCAVFQLSIAGVHLN